MRLAGVRSHHRDSLSSRPTSTSSPLISFLCLRNDEPYADRHMTCRQEVVTPRSVRTSWPSSDWALTSEPSPSVRRSRPYMPANAQADKHWLFNSCIIQNSVDAQPYISLECLVAFQSCVQNTITPFYGAIQHYFEV
jgi:hypothetical protein